ncbi:MAG: LamG domain-containing protein [Nitrospirae bacterium]|nr:LamG domain-containing protein [Nitrospirota bacterium]
MKRLYFALIATIFVLCAAMGYAQDIDESLLLYMSFDTVDGDTVPDHSLHGNDGEIAGNPKLVDGKFGKALEFNGQSDWVTVPHAEILTVDKEVTVMAWINTPRHTGPGGAQWQGILAKGNGQRSYSLYTDQAVSGLHFSVGGSGTQSAVQVALDEWQHVTAQVVKGNTHRYYINGELAGEFGGQNPPPGVADTEDALIGKTHEGSREFEGLIDEVRIWNRALTEDEVKEQMNSGFDDIFAVEARDKLATTWGKLKLKHR